MGAMGGTTSVRVAFAALASGPLPRGRTAWAGASVSWVAEPGPRAPGRQVPAPQTRPGALSAAPGRLRAVLTRSVSLSFS